jgi:hypothetical protein
MLTSRRDYILRIIDEVSRILGQIVFKRRAGADQEALETVVVGLERLFVMDADQVFLLTPDQHYTLLADDESGEFARDKILLYAALSTEAGAIYATQGKTEMARATRLNALRFVLKARMNYSNDALPVYAPNPADLLQTLAGEPLDATTAELVAAFARMRG